MLPPPQNWTDIHYTSRDGLRLYARHYGSGTSIRRPAICLAGLTNNCRDFHDLASILSDPRGHRRDVYCLDYRGRGRSEHCPDGSGYTVMNEVADVLDFMAIKGLSNAAIIGTSRGGIVAMALAAVRPAAIGAVVLNDIGPVIERDGLARLIAYVGRVPLPSTWDEATQLVKRLNERAFPYEPLTTWQQVARQLYNEEDGRPAPGYDSKLSQAISLSNGLQTSLWPQFSALSRVPALALRGANSDILSAQTLVEMARRHPALTSVTVPDQGHAPLLKDRPTLAAIYEFLFANDPDVMIEPAPRTERPIRIAS